MDMKWWAGPSYIHIYNTFKNAEKKNILEKKKNTYWIFIVPKTFYKHWSHYKQ